MKYLVGKFLALRHQGLVIYPIVIILLIPTLLVVNTLWNLRSFNRDSNFILRHQAVQLTDTLKSLLISGHFDQQTIGLLIENWNKTSEDIVAVAILTPSSDGYQIYAVSGDVDAEKIETDTLNKLAIGFEQSFAGLEYDPTLTRSVWTVVSPIKDTSAGSYLVVIRFDTLSVNEILDRTTRDSLIILAILIVLVLIVLTNHFYFYIRTLRTRQLEELDRLKTEFVSMAAHELKTPITALIGYTSLLKKKIVSEDKSINTYIDTLLTVTDDLNTIVADILDVSRIEQGRLAVTIGDTDVNKLIQQVITQLTPIAEEKNLAISFEKQEIPIVPNDAARLKQIIKNLMSNSIKYTLQGTVAISTATEGKTIRVVIKDTGIGIPPDEMKKLFSKFHRVQDSKTKEARGTGLGLWITKQMVEMLGGTIAVESIYGTGTSVTLVFPRER